jgi:uncharacterized membrane protein YoaK (UPF0700 family)
MQTFHEINGRRFQAHTPEAARVVRDFSAIVLAFLSGAIGGGATTKAFGDNGLW